MLVSPAETDGVAVVVWEIPNAEKLIHVRLFQADVVPARFGEGDFMNQLRASRYAR
jgi:hypothetical protein